MFSIIATCEKDSKTIVRMIDLISKQDLMDLIDLLTQEGYYNFTIRRLGK